MSKSTAEWKETKWSRVFLVCKACRRRGSGPKDVKPKALASDLRRLAKNERPRARILLTECLGLCPKAATAVARVGGAAPARIVGVRSRAELASVAARLAGDAIVDTQDRTSMPPDALPMSPTDPLA